MPGPVRSRRIATLLAVAALALAGCGEQTGSAPPAAPAPAAVPAVTSVPTTAPNADPFADAAGRFDLAPPTDWTVDTSGAQGTAAVFLSPDQVSTPQGPFQPNVNVIIAPSPGAQLDGLLDSTRTQLTTQLSGYKSTTDDAVTLTDGTAAHLFGGTFTDQASGLELRNLQLFTVDGASVYVVTGTAPTSAWSTYEPLLDASLRSLTLKE
jgi:hypothetical protein